MNNNYTYTSSVTNFDHEINRDAMKNINRRSIQLDYEMARELQRQKISENRKKQIDVVSIQNDGTLEIQTKNLDIAVNKRMLCNFKNPRILKLFSRTDSKNILLFECEIDGKFNVKVYLNEKKLGDSKYLLERFTAKGLEIYGASKKIREDYVSKIWTVTLNKNSAECLIPDEFGWWLNSEGKWEFVDKDRVIWQEVKTWS